MLFSNNKQNLCNISAIVKINPQSHVEIWTQDFVNFNYFNFRGAIKKRKCPKMWKKSIILLIRVINMLREDCDFYDIQIQCGSHFRGNQHFLKGSPL